jgi:hypothetical protein
LTTSTRQAPSAVCMAYSVTASTRTKVRPAQTRCHGRSATTGS